jgi:hypothetical protein
MLQVVTLCPPLPKVDIRRLCCGFNLRHPPLAWACGGMLDSGVFALKYAGGVGMLPIVFNF